MNFEEFMELNKLRVLMDEDIPKAKQFLTNFLKKYNDYIIGRKINK